MRASEDAGVKRVEADAIGQLGRVGDVPDGQIGAQAGAMRPRSDRPSARAAFSVTPRRHSAGVMRNSVAPMFMVSRIEVSGEVPGLQSVASAIGTPASRRP